MAMAAAAAAAACCEHLCAPARGARQQRQVDGVTCFSSSRKVASAGGGARQWRVVKCSAARANSQGGGGGRWSRLGAVDSTVPRFSFASSSSWWWCPRLGASYRRRKLKNAVCVVRSMARDDPVAKRAKDQQNIEDFMPDLDELDKDELQGFLELELESSLDLETMKHYEIMFLIHEKYADEVQAVIKKVQDFITERKGVIYRLNDWGMRSLAYDIKKASRANYVLMNIKINSQDINVLNSLFEKDERVIRHMVMSQKVAITQDSLPAEEYRPSRVAEEEEEEEEEEYEDEDEEEDEEQEEIELVLQRE